VVNSIVGLAAYWGRRFDDAITQLKNTMTMDPSFPQTYLYLCWAYAGKQAWAESIAACDRFVKLTNGSVISLSYFGMVSALAGDAARARETLEQLDFLARGRYVSPLYRGLIHLGLGETDETMRYLELARQDRESFLPVICSFPLIDPIRNDPRFAELLAKMGLTGSFPPSGGDAHRPTSGVQ
jgi:tetratricopeptide (TPR) repeat protein